MRRSQKLAYASGMISLILLPLFCMQYFLHRQKQVASQYTLELTVPNKSEAPEVFKKIPQNCQRIILRDDANDDIKLNYARAIIHEGLSPRDIPQLEFIFTNRSKYRSLVKLLEICLVENVQHYLLHQNKFWIFAPVFKPMSPQHINGSVMPCGFVCRVIDNSYQIPSLESVTIEKFILPAILFTVMIGLLILKTRIVAMRTAKLKQPKTFEPPSDNPDV